MRAVEMTFDVTLTEDKNKFKLVSRSRAAGAAAGKGATEGASGQLAMGGSPPPPGFNLGARSIDPGGGVGFAAGSDKVGRGSFNRDS